MNAWNNFNGGNWENEINVRDFIQKNYTPYDGDGAFLAHARLRCVRSSTHCSRRSAKRAVSAISTPRPLSPSRRSARAISTRTTR